MSHIKHFKQSFNSGRGQADSATSDIDRMVRPLSPFNPGSETWKSAFDMGSIGPRELKPVFHNRPLLEILKGWTYIRKNS